MDNLLNTITDIHQFLPGFGGWNVMAAYKYECINPKQSTRKNKCNDYKCWINSQLKKRPNTKPVEDLSRDLSDGVALIYLIKVVAGVDLEGFKPDAQSHTDQLSNVNLVLQFMKHQKIPMHYICSEDIISGDVRSIMRLVLALAAHYKPNAVCHSNSHKMSAVGYAHSASTALAEAQRHVSTIVPKPQKPPPFHTWRTPVYESKDNAHDSNKLTDDRSRHSDLIYAYATLSREHSDLVSCHGGILQELVAVKSAAEQLFLLLNESQEDGGGLSDDSQQIEKISMEKNGCQCKLSDTFLQMHRLLNILESYHHHPDCHQTKKQQSEASYPKIMKELLNQLNRLANVDLKQPDILNSESITND